MVVGPFGGNYWKNGKTSSFEAVELFVGLDGTYGPSNAQIRVGGFGWYATPHKIGGAVQGVGRGAHFNTPLRDSDELKSCWRSNRDQSERHCPYSPGPQGPKKQGLSCLCGLGYQAGGTPSASEKNSKHPAWSVHSNRPKQK
jgi:hypothetical protein